MILIAFERDVLLMNSQNICPEGRNALQTEELVQMACKTALPWTTLK